MSTSMGAVQTSISNMYGDLYADLQVGDNGYQYGDPTYSIGDDWGEESWGYNQWDNNMSDGFDTKAVAVMFVGATNGQESLSGPGTTINYNGDAFSSISSVELQAAVNVTAEAKWTGISAKFYRSGALIETITVGTGPDANTINNPAHPTAEQILTIIPTHMDCDKVQVSGTIQMTSPAGTYPGSTDMFCNVFINGRTA